MKDKLINQSIQRRVTPFRSVLEEVPVQQADNLFQNNEQRSYT